MSRVGPNLVSAVGPIGLDIPTGPCRRPVHGPTGGRVISIPVGDQVSLCAVPSSSGSTTRTWPRRRYPISKTPPFGTSWSGLRTPARSVLVPPLGALSMRHRRWVRYWYLWHRESAVMCPPRPRGCDARDRRLSRRPLRRTRRRSVRPGTGDQGDPGPPQRLTFRGGVTTPKAKRYGRTPRGGR